MATTSALLTNNAASSLASGITNVAVSMTVAAGGGARFPNPGASEYFYVTLSNAAGSSIEIVKCTARATDVFTIVRGQDGTSGIAFNTGDIVELRPVAALLREKADIDSPTFLNVPAAPTAAARTKTTQVATTDFVVTEVNTVVENAQVGTTYTLVLADTGKMVSMSNAAAITLTIPANASVAFPVNTRIDLLQLGAGQVTISPTGITLQSSGSKQKLTGQYSGATLWKKATDTWVLIGDIAT